MNTQPSQGFQTRTARPDSGRQSPSRSKTPGQQKQKKPKQKNGRGDMNSESARGSHHNSRTPPKDRNKESFGPTGPSNVSSTEKIRPKNLDGNGDVEPEQEVSFNKGQMRNSHKKSQITRRGSGEILSSKLRKDKPQKFFHARSLSDYDFEINAEINDYDNKVIPSKDINRQNPLFVSNLNGERQGWTDTRNTETSFLKGGKDQFTFDSLKVGAEKVQEGIRLSSVDTHTPTNQYVKTVDPESLKLHAAPKSTSEPLFFDGITLRKTLFRLSIYLILIAAVFYAVIPLTLLFAAHDYQNEELLVNLNFGILGLFQGCLEILYLYKLIDVPIKRKVREIEGRNKGLINLKNFVIISPWSIAIILVLGAGIQIGAGNFMKGLDITIGPTQILVSSIIPTVVKGAILVSFIYFRTPSSIFIDKKLVKKELKQITKIRKDFVEDLLNTKRHLDTLELQQIYTRNDMLYTNNEPMVLPAAAVLAQTQAQAPNVDFRKFSRGSYDYGREFKMLRIQSVKIYLILIITYCQILALYGIVKGISEISVVILGLLVFVCFRLVSFIFGLLDVSTSIASFHMNLMKITSMVASAAVYRFLYLQVENKGEMIGILAIKMVYKILIYCGGIMYGGDIINSLKIKFRFGRYGRSKSEMEFSKLKFRRYLFEKYILFQKIDFFFALGTLLPIALATDAFPSVKFDLALKCGDLTFYVCLVIVEVILDAILTAVFVFLAQKKLRNTTKSLDKGLIREIYKTINHSKVMTSSLEILMLYLMFFLFLNMTPHN